MLLSSALRSPRPRVCDHVLCSAGHALRPLPLIVVDAKPGSKRVGFLVNGGGRVPEHGQNPHKLSARHSPAQPVEPRVLKVRPLGSEGEILVHDLGVHFASFLSCAAWLSLFILRFLFVSERSKTRIRKIFLRDISIIRSRYETPQTPCCVFFGYGFTAPLSTDARRQ